MEVSIAVPQLGPNMYEATIVTWLKAVGDTVSTGEVIAEVMTDKVNIDVEAPAAGVLVAVLAQPGEVMGVDGVMGTIETGEVGG